MTGSPDNPFSLVARGPMLAPRKLKIAAFDGARVFPRPEKARTLGGCVDYGEAIRVTCDCARRVVEIWPQRLLELKDGPAESLPVREATTYLRCRECGQKGIAMTDASGRWTPGMVPRVRVLGPLISSRGTSSMPGIGGDSFGRPSEAAPDDRPKGPRGRRRVFKAR